MEEAAHYRPYIKSVLKENHVKSNKASVSLWGAAMETKRSHQIEYSV